MKTPTTITLHGFSQQLFEVNQAFWLKMYRQAERSKRWARKVKNDQKWLDGACTESKKHLQEVLTKTTVEIANDGYRYWFLRAEISEGPYPQIDEQAYKQWIELTGIKPSEYVVNHKVKEPAQ
jgi:hypothetical protein